MLDYRLSGVLVSSRNETASGYLALVQMIVPSGPRKPN